LAASEEGLSSMSERAFFVGELANEKLQQQK
jgi:hypothetical protein